MTARGTHYAIRQARSRVVGSRAMTEAEATREVELWALEIAPARAVPVTPALRRAVAAYDQDVLVETLYGPPPE